MMAASDCCKIRFKQHQVFFFSIAVSVLPCIAPRATGFSIGENLKRSAVVVFSSTNPKREASERPRPSYTELEGMDETEILPMISAETNVSASAISVDYSSEDRSISGADSFSKFTASQTPLLAKLLSTDRETKPSSSGTSRSIEETKGSFQPTIWQERSSEWALVGLSTFALVKILGDLLSNYEWVQTLRYLWPLSLGVYYGLLLNQSSDRGASLRMKKVEEFGPSVAFSPNKNDDEIRDLLIQIGYVFGGFGLFIGGLADALLPVWMTGPNWITNAGLAPDCAVLLLILSVGDKYSFFQNNENHESDGSQSAKSNRNPVATGMAPLLLQITLWAELYKLGEGSLDEVFTSLQIIFSSST